VIWDFELDGQSHRVLLDSSYITSRRKVAFDGSLLFKGSKALRKEFVYCFIVLNHSFKVVEGKHILDFYVDNFSFKQLYISAQVGTLPVPRVYEDWAPPSKVAPEEQKSQPQLSDDFLELDVDAPPTHILSPGKSKLQRDIFAAPEVKVRGSSKTTDLLDL
jgi:hypothetical protein